MAKTAVQMLIKKLTSHTANSNIKFTDIDIFIEALEAERDQILEAYKIARITRYDPHYDQAIKYYLETYND